MIQKMFSPDDINPPEACTMFMPDNEPDDEEYATENRKQILSPVSHLERVQSLYRNIFTREREL